jgi:hypothetical protein
VFILIFIILFAIGLGPIPYVYSNEVFPVEARAAGLSLAMFIVRVIIVNTFNEMFDFFIELVLQLFAGSIFPGASIGYWRLCISYFWCVRGFGIRFTFLQGTIYSFHLIFLIQ